MKWLKTIRRLLQLVMMPLRRNWSFFVFMYLLGCVTAWATLPNMRGVKLYGNLYPELFLDVYVLAAILTVLPHKVRIWVRGIFYFALYASTTLCLLVADNVIGKQSLLTDTIPIFNCGMLLIISDILLLIYCFPLIRSMLRLFRHPHGL